jgi:hypothetical protein
LIAGAWRWKRHNPLENTQIFLLLLLIKRYNLYNVLACSTTFFHLSLLCTTFFQSHIIRKYLPIKNDLTPHKTLKSSTHHTYLEHSSGVIWKHQLLQSHTQNNLSHVSAFCIIIPL